MPILDAIQHYGGIRIRVKGSGNLDLILYSLDDTYSEELNSVVMATTSERFVTKLANFNQPRARLKIRVDAINEYFEINQVTVYVKPIHVSYPQ